MAANLHEMFGLPDKPGDQRAQLEHFQAWWNQRGSSETGLI